MKRGIWLVLAALVVSQVLGMGSREPETVTATLYGPEDITVTGICIVEAEEIEPPWTGDWTPVLPQGQRAAAGETLFQWQPSGRISQRLARETDSWKELLSRRAAIHEAIAQLPKNPDSAVTLTAAMLAEGGQRVSWEENSEVPEITAPVSGIFSTFADGLDVLLTPENPWAEWSLPQEGQAVGRLITGDRWYFRTERLAASPGERVTVRLLGGLGITVTMTVAEETDMGTLLSCDQGLEKIAACRYLTVKITSNEKTGLEIPASAIYTVNGETGVWCLVGEETQFKTVTLRKITGEQAVVELDQSSTDNLWPGDQVIR